MKNLFLRNILFCYLFPCFLLCQNTASSSIFDYTVFDYLLKNYVKNVRIDYKSLASERNKLVDFTNKLGEISPDSNPEYFPNKEDKLSYWINAYNAFILLTVLDNYPIKSIKDINFIGATIWLEKQLIGGKLISFKSLEDDIIRDRFKDPRIHFAINCASVSCPPLLNAAYVPDKLDQQLNNSTIKFINDETNFRVDVKNKSIYISAIFDWYKEDFFEWLKLSKQINDPVILDYIGIYLNKNIESTWYNFKIEVNDYDWSLNDAK